MPNQFFSLLQLTDLQLFNPMPIGLSAANPNHRFHAFHEPASAYLRMPKAPTHHFSLDLGTRQPQTATANHRKDAQGTKKAFVLRADSQVGHKEKSGTPEDTIHPPNGCKLATCGVRSSHHRLGDLVAKEEEKKEKGEKEEKEEMFVTYFRPAPPAA
jgi:hypothetical protein